ncbi:unnamed protein product, partial [Trichogramma brassicae]
TEAAPSERDANVSAGVYGLSRLYRDRLAHARGQRKRNTTLVRVLAGARGWSTRSAATTTAAKAVTGSSPRRNRSDSSNDIDAMVQLQPASEEQQQRARRLLELAGLGRDDEPMTMMQDDEELDKEGARRRRRKTPERSVSFNRDVHVKRIAERERETGTSRLRSSVGDFFALDHPQQQQQQRLRFVIRALISLLSLSHACKKTLVAACTRRFLVSFFERLHFHDVVRRARYTRPALIIYTYVHFHMRKSTRHRPRSKPQKKKKIKTWRADVQPMQRDSYIRCIYFVLRGVVRTKCHLIEGLLIRRAAPSNNDRRGLAQAHKCAVLCARTCRHRREKSQLREILYANALLRLLVCDHLLWKRISSALRYIGRSPSPASVTTALAGDGVGTFVTFPLRKESARTLSREDLAEEAVRVLEQADSVDCVARSNESRKYASLPGRGNRKSKERNNSGDTGSYLGHSKPKKKALGRSVSDAADAATAAASVVRSQPSSRYQARYQGSSSPDRSLPELEEDEPESQYQRIGQPRRRGPPLQRSSSDLLRKQQPAAPPLTPIIEASPHPASAERSFRFSSVSPPAPVEPPRVKTIPIYVESENRLYVGEQQRQQQEDIDVVDGDMLHRSSRYDHHPQQQQQQQQQQQRDDSTIHKMIHRLSNDRSPPPQLTRAMVAPSPGFAHNNNRPFSYTRPSEIPTSDHHHQAQHHALTTSVRPQSPTDCIYAQVQMDKKKSALLNQAQRSHSDSDEGLGLERKDSSRENSPADKEAFHRSSNNGTGGQYRYLDSELQRHNDINSYKSSSAGNGNNVTTTRFGDSGGADSKNRLDTTTALDRGRADGMADAARRRVNGVDELSSRVVNERPPSLNKSSDLSARRDLLESRIKMFSSKDSSSSSSINKLLSPSGKKLVLEQEAIIVDKPIVPSPVVPAAQPKRYLDTYISETRTNSNGEKYMFEKEMHDENGKVYGFEKITNKVTNNGHSELPLVKPKQGYVLETRTDKYGDKYIVETRNYSAEPSSTLAATATIENGGGGTKKDEGHSRHHRGELYQPRAKKNFEAMRHGGYSKSTQRLNELSSSSSSPRVKDAAHRYVTRSYENLASSSSAAADSTRRPGVLGGGGRRPKLGALREGPLDDYDTDISQATNSQLDSSSASKFYSKETRTMQHYHRPGRGLHDDYDSSPPRHHRLVNSNGYNSSRYDSDTTTRDSVVRGGGYHHRKGGVTSDPDEPKKPLRRSRNHLDYAHLDERSKSAFDEGPLPPPQRPPRHNARDHHRGLGRSSHHNHHHHHHHHHHRNDEVRTETRLSDSERKDRLADSGIENDYRPTHRAESEEDDSFATAQFLKQERRHTDRSMPIDKKSQQQRNGGGYDKYVMYYNDKPPLTGKPPLGPGLVDASSSSSGSKSKYEKKAAKKSGGGGGTMSKVRELFRKKEKKQVKEDKMCGVGGLLLKRSGRAASTGALTDDEVTVRYREYRGDQLRSARSARDLESDINERINGNAASQARAIASASPRRFLFLQSFVSYILYVSCSARYKACYIMHYYQYMYAGTRSSSSSVKRRTTRQ